MALPPQDKDNEAFYREVDEELRRAQLTGFFARYGKVLVAAVLVFLVVLAGYLWWQHRSEVKAGEQAEQLDAIFDDINAHKIKGGDTRLDSLAKDGNTGYRAAALMTKAALAVRNNNQPGAIDAFKKVEADDDLPQPYRDVALIRRTALEFDKLPPAEVVARLKQFAVPDNPWFGTAGEMVAIAYIKQKRSDLAAPIFAAMAKDQTVPEPIRLRATQMAGSLGVSDASVNKEVTR